MPKEKKSGESEYTESKSRQTDPSRCGGAGVVRLYYFVSCCQQVVGHLVQVGSLVCVNEAHHLFENLRLHIVDLHAVLTERDGE